MTFAPWHQALERALYGPDGFFLRESPGHHFRTSVTATPLFARAVRELAGRVDEALGRPDPFDLVDVGAAGGELLSALPDVPARWRLTGVDLAPDPGTGVGWAREVPEVEGLLLANEWLDDVPLHVLFDGRVVEVDEEGTERLGEPAPQELLDWAVRWWPQGRRVEVGLTRDRAWAQAVGRVRRGVAVAVDYGHVLGDRSDFGDRRPTLTGYRDGRQVHPVLDGSCDVTAHVALDSCLAATGGRLLFQRDALAQLGVDATAPPRSLSATDPRGYLARLQEAGAAAELLDRCGLGSFGWLVCPVGGRTRSPPRLGRVALREQVVGIGAAAHAGTVDGGDVTVLPLGPHHPSTHGVLQLALTVDGDTVVTADPVVGFLHRGAEKLFEVRDYRQLVMLANRHDWLSAFSNELGIVLAVERMLGMQVPDRAVWLRTLLAELNRVLNHLLFLGTLDPAVQQLFSEREVLQHVMEEATGGRVHYQYNRVGGLREDVPLGWTDRVRQAVEGARTALPALRASYDGVGAGVAVLAREVVLSHGVSGPLARASGVDLDLRRDEPYLAYGELDVPVAVRSGGDAAARFACVLDQVGTSLDLVDTCLDRLPAGAVNLRLPKTVKAPEGSTYAWTENPLGISGYYLVSRGDRVPWRLAMRTASFNNVSALSSALPGTRVQDLTTALASFFFVVGDIDK